VQQPPYVISSPRVLTPLLSTCKLPSHPDRPQTQRVGGVLPVWTYRDDAINQNSYHPRLRWLDFFLQRREADLQGVPY
jgi:hypothetical protein